MRGKADFHVFTLGIQGQLTFLERGTWRLGSDGACSVHRSGLGRLCAEEEQGIGLKCRRGVTRTQVHRLTLLTTSWVC